MGSDVDKYARIAQEFSWIWIMIWDVWYMDFCFTRAVPMVLCIPYIMFETKSCNISYCGLSLIIWKVRFIRQRVPVTTRTFISCRPTSVTCISRNEIGIWFSFVKLATATIGCVQITNLFKSIKRPSSTQSNPLFWKKKI